MTLLRPVEVGSVEGEVLDRVLQYGGISLKKFRFLSSVYFTGDCFIIFIFHIESHRYRGTKN
jgi:hypothetical protein